MISTHTLRTLAAALALGSLAACGGGGGETSGSGVATPSSGTELAASKAVTVAATSGSSIVVRARASLAGGIGANMVVRADGQVIGSVIVSNTAAYQDYVFSAPTALTAGSGVDVVFTNDGVTVVNGVRTEDRNLFVESITVDGRAPLASNASGVTIDKGAGNAAFDGIDVIPGQSVIPWNAALRYVLPASYGSGHSLTVNASATLVGGVGAAMTVRVDGAVVGQATVGNVGQTQPYVFTLAQAPAAGAVIDVAFTNDAVTVVNGVRTEDRNLIVQSIAIDAGTPILATASNVKVDKGSGAAAFDGIDVIPGQAGLWWNAAQRYTLGGGTPPLNPVQIENAKTAADGVSTDWQIQDAELANGEITGYASATSVNRGASIDFLISVAQPSASPTYTIDIFRMGWYGGQGGRRIAGPISRTSSKQASCPTVDTKLHTVECNWKVSYTFQVPSSATDPTVAMSGVYLVKIKTSAGKAAYMTFVVRDDSRSGDILFHTASNTYHAYNPWGGYSLYTTPTTARMLSFNRPYGGPYGSASAGQLMDYELPTVRFLERNGYDVLYQSNIDTHRNGARLLQFKTFLSAGHDEYWTLAMRNNIEAARDAGKNMVFLGANTGYWAVRLEPDAQGRADRRMVGYKYWAAAEDPKYPGPESTTMWREYPLDRPEASLLGVQYQDDPVDGDIVMTGNCPTWMCQGTGLVAGSRLPGLLGYEVDVIAPSSPANLIELAHSPYTTLDGANSGVSSMGYYVHSSGAQVFATGSMQWAWGLDAYSDHPERVNPAAQQLTKNVLDRFVGR